MKKFQTLFAGQAAGIAAAAAMFALAAAPNLPAQSTTQEAEQTMTEEIDDTMATTRPTEIRRGVAMDGQDGKSREQRTYERVIAKIEPDLVGDPERVPIYLNAYTNAFISDLKLFAYDVEAEWLADSETVRLTGYAEYPEMAQATGKLYHYLGFENIDNRIEVLPGESLGEKKFGIVKSAFAYTYGDPVEPRETMTTDFLGDPLFLLKKAEGDTYLCHTSEGYIGYIDAEHVMAVDAEEFEAWKESARATFRETVMVGEQKIPAGARLPLVAEKPAEENTVIVRLPGGEVAEVPAASVELRQDEPAERAEAAIAVSRALLGTPYVWGGKTAAGVDCSGLVQTAYRAQGINLPRDAYMQAYVGTLTATRWFRQGMRRGDLMFFLDSRGRIHHVAIYLGDDQFIEATGPGVSITSLNPEDENYSERRDRSFAFAKRVLE